jgi:hypothetical protein
MCFTLSFFSLQASAVSNEKPSSSAAARSSETINAIEVKGLLKNAEKLNAVDKSTLASKDKMASQPVTSARNRRHDGGVIYISSGTVIIILLLVILL